MADDIDSEILSIFSEGDSYHANDVTALLTQKGLSYPVKRVRNRLRSLSEHGYLICEPREKDGNMSGLGPTHYYSLPSTEA